MIISPCDYPKEIVTVHYQLFCAVITKRVTQRRYMARQSRKIETHM